MVLQREMVQPVRNRTEQVMVVRLQVRCHTHTHTLVPRKKRRKIISEHRARKVFRKQVVVVVVLAIVQPGRSPSVFCEVQTTFLPTQRSTNREKEF